MFNVQSIKLKVQSIKFFTSVHLYICTLAAFTVFSLFTFSSCDKEERLYGRWRLQDVYMNGDTLNDSLQYNVIKNSIYTFFYANSFTVTTFVNGIVTTSSDGFYHFINNSTINMRYTITYQPYDITATIKKLNQKELKLEYDDKGNHYLLILYTY